MEEIYLEMRSLLGEMERKRDKQHGRADENGERCGDVRRGYDPLLCTEVMFSDEEDFYTARLFKVNTYTNADLGKR